jgi:hypothetical protein
MVSSYVVDKEHARLQEVEQLLRFFCRSKRRGDPTPSGMVWLSSRTLTGKKLYRGATATMILARQLAEMGYVGRATAFGRGRGRGRTLYWLPGVKKWQVLMELRREGMPNSAILQALAFYLRTERVSSGENVTDQTRQWSLRSSTFGTNTEKGTPARPARRSRAPSGPPSSTTKLTQTLSTPPSLGRLTKHGWEPAPLDFAAIVVGLLNRNAQRPGRITDDPATHPEGCECSDCSARRSP